MKLNLRQTVIEFLNSYAEQRFTARTSPAGYSKIIGRLAKKSAVIANRT